MRSRTRRLFPTLIAITLAAGALAACGGGDDEESGSTAKAPEATTQPANTGEAAGGGGGQQMAAQGAEIFNSAGCASCHTLAAADASGVVGPNLDEMVAGMSAAEIKMSIVDPNAKITAGYSADIMPGNFADTLTPAQIDALAAFIAQNAGNS